MSYRSKLQLAFLALGILAIASTGWVLSRGATAALSTATYDRLTDVRNTHVRQVEQWFQDLGNHVLALSTDESTISALEQLGQSWKQLPPVDTNGLDQLYRETGIGEKWIPRDPLVRRLQFHFIAANPFPVGRKDRMLEGPGHYGQVHSRYHPTLSRYQSAFGFYDVLLISADDARVVYSVFKELDLGVSLREAPHSGTALARIFERAMKLNEPEQFVLDDFVPYEPSKSLPAAFLAAPVWRGGVKAGVLAIQISPVELNRLITTDRMGQTGRVSIVGPDMLLRTGPTFMTEKVSNLRSEPEGGRQMLRSHAPLRIPGLKWLLLAEIDAREALAPVDALRNLLIGVGCIVTVAILILATLLAGSVTQPVAALARAADRLGQRDFSARLPVDSADELGQLAMAFNRMADHLEATTVSKSEQEALAAKLITAQEDERQRIARELHDDISQRLAALAIQSAGAPGSAEFKASIASLARDIHGLSRGLHPKMLDDLGLVAAIESECRALFERGGPVVEFEAEGDWSKVPKPVVLALFRIVQEALRNAEKYAEADEIRIALDQKWQTARLVVSDNGRGFVVTRKGANTGLGLASMEERTRSLAGRLEVDSKPGKGTSIRVWLPLHEQENRNPGG